MAYETSYASGRKPFTPDAQRGYWASPTDFVYVCLCFAFKTDLLGLTYYFLLQLGIYGLIPFLIAAAIIVVPTMFILMYLGQFSSTGFITALRISPIFKGIGYVNLFTNLVLLAYYTIFTTVPMLYLINSFRSILPWSCEAMQTWANASDVSLGKFCNWTLLENESDAIATNETLVGSTNYTDSKDLNEFEKDIVYIPSAAYFTSYFSKLILNNYTVVEFSLSWELVICSFVAWAIIALFFLLCFETEQLGRLLRYLFWIVLGLLTVCIVRFAFLPGAHKAFVELLHPPRHQLYFPAVSIPVSLFHAFSSGWGNLVTLASHNRFQTNIMRYSWIVCFGQLAISIGFALLMRLIENHLFDIEHVSNLAHVDTHWTLYLSTGSALANMAWPNFWSILYFLTLMLGSLLVMITSLITIFTSIFDEYEKLRKHKPELRMSLIAVLALGCIAFCSNQGLQYFENFYIDSLFKQYTICLLLISAVLWIYGRVQFQRDIEFMFRQPFATWKIYVLRVVTPPALILSLLLVLMYIADSRNPLHEYKFHWISFWLILLPLLLIPIYGIIVMLQTTGPLCARFKRCCRATDWYPSTKEDRQRYEEELGNMDITQQLHEVSNVVQ